MYPSMFRHVNGRKISVKGEFGRPEYYPAPPDNENLLFFIQSNQNVNTVVYEANTLLDGRLNLIEPIKVYWHKFTDNGQIKQLNYIQRKLAYGYDFKSINDDVIQFNMVSYDKITFYLDKIKEGKRTVFTRISGLLSKLSNIYVYAEDFGLFPDVKYIELYGHHTQTGEPAYERIYIQ